MAKRGLVTLFAALLALAWQSDVANAVSWLPAAGCTTNCRDDHTCLKTDTGCSDAWSVCPEGFEAIRSVNQTDRDDCKDTGCTIGGCELLADGPYEEVSHKQCLFSKDCVGRAGVCQDEHCCRIKPRLTCCQRLDCITQYTECVVPQQLSLHDPSRSNVTSTRLAGDGSTAPFPFYSAAQLPPGGSCQAALLWGRCTCNDGVSSPGCDANNSSTWEAAADSTSGSTTLPPNLSLTCVVLDPSSPTSSTPSATPTPAADGAAANAPAGGTASSSSSPPLPPAGADAPRRKVHSGVTVAVVVVSCVLAAALLVLAVGWCCGMLPNWQQLRAGSYEPMFTGQSYTPGLGNLQQHQQQDTPWNRLCAAVGAAYDRAAARYPQLLRLRRVGRRYSGSGSGGDKYRRLSSPAGARGGGGGGAGGGGVGSNGVGGERDELSDELSDDVFTLHDLRNELQTGSGRPGGAAGVVEAGGRAARGWGGWGQQQQQQYYGAGGGGGGVLVPGAARGAELEMGVAGGRRVGAAGGRLGEVGGEVVHTRMFSLEDDEEEGADLDAPLQVTGVGPGPGGHHGRSGR